MRTESLVSRGQEKDLLRELVSGGGYTALARSMALAVQVGVGIVQAHYLSPTEFGLFGMVTTLTSFILVFKELGLSYATVQRQEITYDQINALFWVNALVGLGLTIGTAASAWPIAGLYKSPEVVPLTLAMSTVFFLSGISVQHAAILKRKMRFREQAMAEVGSAILGALSGLLLVFWGAGVWALVSMQLVKGVAFNLMIWWFLPWLPSRPRRTADLRSLLTFGGNIMAFDLVNYFSKNVDRILIGRVCGAGILGFYGKALELITLPITQIRGPLTVVAIPALSSLQKDPERFRRYFLAIAQVNAALCLPAMLWLALAADQLVPMLLGDQWIDAVPYFRLLALAGVFQSTVGILGTMLIASGESRRYFLWGLWHGTAMVLCYFTVLFFEPLVMVKLFVVTNAAVFVPSVYYCSRKSPLRPGAFLRAHLLPFSFGTLGVLAWEACGWLGLDSTALPVFAGRSLVFAVVAMCWILARRDVIRGAIRPPGRGRGAAPGGDLNTGPAVRLD